MALQPAELVASSAVGVAGVVLVEIGRRDRSPVLYLAGAAVCAYAVVGLVRVVVGKENPGRLIEQPAPGFGSA